MTYVPHAFTRKMNDKWWILLVTPSGLTARLLTNYGTKAAAEHAIGIFGFALITPPTTPVFVRPSLSPH